MKYSKEFEKLVKNCVSNNAHIGEGNPSAKILFVGQEAAYDGKTDEYKANIIKWDSHINNLESDLNFEYRNDFSSGHTWRKYQKLHDYIFPEFIASEGRINFHERIFTTEMSDNPAKKNSQTKIYPNFKSDLQQRKDSFFNEKFIQDFKIIVLACSKYIVNNEKNWEINNLFEVEYVGDDFETIDGLKGTKYYSRGNWYFLHLNTNKTKLVIHTRQLSSNVNDELLKDMGKIIREHLIKINLLQ